MKYRAITGENFYYQEMKNACRFIVENGEVEDLKERFLEEDILDHISESNFKKKYTTISRRLKKMNSEIISAIAVEDSYTGKFLNLYAILCSERIVREFAYEVLREKYFNYDYKVDSHDFKSFIKEKEEQSEDVAKWTDGGKKKVIVKIVNFLIEGGFIVKEGEDTYRITKPLILPEIIEILSENNNEMVLKGMLY